MFHRTAKFTAEYYKEGGNFLYLDIKVIYREVKTDLSVKSTDTHRFLDSISSHSCKEEIPYSQALRPNRICSRNKNFDKRSNNLKKWLMERDCNEKMIRKQILRAREHSRNDLFEREKP